MADDPAAAPAAGGAAGAPNVDWFYGDWVRRDAGRPPPAAPLVADDDLRRHRTGERLRHRADVAARRPGGAPPGGVVAGAGGARAAAPRRLHGGVVVKPRQFLGACRTHRGCGGAETCRFRFDAATLTDPRTAAPPRHTGPGDPAAAWGCVVSRFAWELETLVGAMEPPPAVVPEHLDYAGLASRFVRYAQHVSAVAPDARPPATLTIRRPSDFYGDDVGFYLRRLATELVWADDGGRRLPDAALADPNLTPADLVRALAPLLDDGERARLKRRLGEWRGLGALRDTLLSLPELDGDPPAPAAPAPPPPPAAPLPRPLPLPAGGAAGARG